MSDRPRTAATNSAEWHDLVAELDRWEETGHVARLWWRDDDAATATPRLFRLLALAGEAPLALAAIPGDAKPDLARAIAPFPQVAVLHHGWCHANRATTGRKSEYPAERHPVDVADELDEGRRALAALFGRRALPVFVPPWNRFADRFVPLLVEARFTALSQMAPRKTAPPRGIAVVDAHLDVTAWRAGRGFIGEGAALARLLTELRARRASGGRTAIGILSHHLVMDDATEDFLGRLGELIAGHPAARWADIAELIPERAAVS